jgi:hypothetical protein
MGPHFVGPITPFGLQKIKGVMCGADVGVKVRAPNLNII